MHVIAASALSLAPLLRLTPSLLAWEAFVALAIVGYGLLGLRIAGRTRAPLSLICCTGIAVWLLLGGWLNLFRWAHRNDLLALLAIGVALFCWLVTRIDLRQRLAALTHTRPTPKSIWVAAAALAAFFTLCFTIHLATFTWNRYDDIQAYIPFAQKSLALGGLQPEPFSERRITSGVGGTIFLDATMLAAGGLPSIDFLEGSLGLLALLLCLRSACKDFALSPPNTLAAFAALAVFTLGRVNLTSVNLSAAIFLAVFLLLRDEALTWHNTLLTGFLLGAAFALKSSNIPFCALLLIFATLAIALRQRSLTPLLHLVIAGAASLLFLLPWLIRHRIDEATALFPSLGLGYHLSHYGFPTIAHTVAPHIALLAALNAFLFPAAAFAVPFVLYRRESRDTSKTITVPLLAFFAAAAISAPLFSLSIAAEDLDRFLMPMENLCAILLLLVVLHTFQSQDRSRPLFAATALFCLWTAFFVHAPLTKILYRDPRDITALFTSTTTPPVLNPYEILLTSSELAANTAQIQRAQQTIPAGEAVLESVQMAYGFDWLRNPILLADYPGMAGPSPGPPLDSTPEAMRLYLLANGIHYLILDRQLYTPVDYASFRQHPQPQIPVIRQLKLFHPPQVQGYSTMEHVVSNHTRELLAGIAAYQPVLYDDGRLRVIALDR